MRRILSARYGVALVGADSLSRVTGDHLRRQLVNVHLQRCRVLIAAAAISTLVVGCGSGSSGSSSSAGNPAAPSPSPSPSPSPAPAPSPGQPAATGSMTAQIDGQPWTAGPGPAGCRLGALVGTSIAICGTDGRYQIGIAVPASVGTHSLGVGSSGVSSVLLIDVTDLSFRTWSPRPSGGSGQVVVTSISSTSVAGTFEFTGPPLTPGTSGTRTVTVGRFVVPVCNGTC